jgi:hypothetical protein
MNTPASPEVEAFYRAGLEGLKYLETREGRGRRFGEAALAAWRALGGELEGTDRLDLLLRDAAATHPLAFAPRLVFDMAWLADDEPFGTEWPGARPALAEGLLRDGKGGGASELAELLRTASQRWALPELFVTPALLDQASKVTAASRILLAGSSAMLALVQTTAGRRDLDLAEQVVVLATNPAERQLWGLALLDATTRTRARVLDAARATSADVRALGVTHLDLLLCDEVLPAAKAIWRELGG